MEGTEIPFLIWTDHKYFTYLRDAKRLTPRQTRWSLFFNRFNYVLTFRPGSKNVKPDALSRHFSPPDVPDLEEGIITPICLVGTLTWTIEKEVREAQQEEPDPGSGPPGTLLVPTSTRSKVLEWLHTNKLSSHSGSALMLSLGRKHFWWPDIASDFKDYATTCSTCARNKTGLLQPLLTPSCPWSHILVDFVTGLPPSEGNTTILTVIDRFLRAAHFNPLTKLPSAFETAQILIQHVFRIHGISTDIVSN